MNFVFLIYVEKSCWGDGSMEERSQEPHPTVTSDNNLVNITSSLLYHHTDKISKIQTVLYNSH